MDTIVKAINELLPLSQYFIKRGYAEQSSASISTAIVLIVLVSGYWILKQIYIRYRNTRLAKNLYPQFDKMSIKEATTRYISTHSQNVSPTLEDEPGFSSKHVFREKLIPFLLKKGFDEMDGANKFHIVLGDSGMGKTTFMVNLYMRYASFWNFRKKGVGIRLFRLGNTDTLERVKEIEFEKRKNTILLLDALDEDPFIVSSDEDISKEEAFITRVDEIIDTAKDFREVVFTCRTQYFPNQDDNPYELKVKRPDEKGYFVLKKMYLSPFTNTEIKKYLNLQYPPYQIWKRKEKRRAYILINNTPKLAVRPMILRYIRDITKEIKSYTTTFEIYETLVQKWYLREALKRKYHNQRGAFIISLHNLSMGIAELMLHQYLNNQGSSITEQDALSLAKKNQIKLTPNEITGQSLLTCDGYNNWKFAHKSILEFYIAKIIKQNSTHLVELLRRKFAGLDMTKLFYDEQGNEIGQILHKHLTNILVSDEEVRKIFNIDSYLIQIQDYTESLRKITTDFFYNYTTELQPETDAKIEDILRKNLSFYEKTFNLKLTNIKYFLITESFLKYNIIDKENKTTGLLIHKSNIDQNNITYNKVFLKLNKKKSHKAMMVLGLEL
jgi:formylglycine-generating enzyme